MMTRNEATERAIKIWGTAEGLVGPHRGGLWSLAMDGGQHYMDGNGHTKCHEECAQLEARITSAPASTPLTELEWETIQDCMLTAIERYQDNVRVLQAHKAKTNIPVNQVTAFHNLEQQFQQQISEARALLQRIEAKIG